VFFGGMFYLGCGLGGGSNSGNGDNRLVAFQVGDTPVYYDVFNQNVTAQREQMQMQKGGASADSLSPQEEAQIEAQVLDQYITSLGTIALAKKAGVKFSDQQITQALERDVLESQITGERTNLVNQKKLKPDANAAEFDAALKKEKIPTVAEIRKRFHENMAKDLKDDKTRPGLEEQVARPLLMASLQASMKPSLEELKATYNTFEFKRILFAAHPGSTVDSQIAKAQADIKAGTTFEQAIDRYSSEPPLKGKKLSDNTIDLSGSQFDMFPEYRALKPLKQGEVSDVIDTPQGKAIYKLILIKNGAPKDLETNTKKYSDMYTMQKAGTEFQNELKKFTQSGQIVWKIAGLKALYDWFQVMRDFTLSPAERTEKMQGVVEEAKKAMGAAGNDTRPAALAWFSAFDSIWSTPTADKVKLRPERIEVLKALTSVQPFFSLRMELVDLLIDSKAADDAVEVLKTAAASNFNYDALGQQNFGDVQAKVIKLKAAGMLSKAAEADINKVQQDWIKANDDAAKQKAEMKKEQEQAKKENDANMAKQKAAAMQQKADAEKAAKGATPAATPPAAAGSTPKPVTPATPAKSAPTATPPVAPPAAGKK
jgi:hypothetical protein